MNKLFAAAVSLALLLMLNTAEASRVPPGTDDEIRQRLQPFGRVCLQGETCEGVQVAAAPAAAGPARSGQEVYDRFCFACHTTGAAGAPRKGAPGDWTERLTQGMDTLWAHTKDGIRGMPPKGTCMDCSDDELRASLDLLLDSL